VVEQPIRNRQAASSTLALGSNIPLEDKDLADSLNCLCPIRCKLAANSEVFAQRIHRAHLRFIHALDVNVLSYPDVAVATPGSIDWTSFAILPKTALASTEVRAIIVHQ
jgi:hypothetical protein